MKARFPNAIACVPGLLLLLGGGALADEDRLTHQSLTGGHSIALVDPGTIPCAVLIDFEALVGGPGTGTNYNFVLDATVHASLAGASFGERLSPQTVAQNGDFDVLNGIPTLPLTVVAGVANQNLAVRDDVLGASQALVGNSAFNGGWPDGRAVGEGAIAIVFDVPQTAISLDVIQDGTPTPGPTTIRFYDANGSLIDTETLSSNDTFGFRVVGGPGPLDLIKAITITNLDNQGIGIDNLCLEVDNGLCDATLTMEGCDEFILPSQDPPPFPVTRDGDSLKVTLVFEDVGDQCDLSNFRAWGVEVEFDNADLTFADATRSAFIDAGDWPSFSAQLIGGTNRVKVQANVGQSGPDDPGAGPVEFATLCFVASDNQSTDADYTFTTTNFTDDFGTEPLFLELNVQPDVHTVTVDLHGTGDVTLNGSLTAGDAQCAAETNFNLAGEGFDVVPAQCVSSNPPPPNECNKAPLERYEADVDCDGLVGLDDADVIFDAAACGLDIVTPEPCLAKIFAACPIPAGRLAASSYAPTNADRRVRLGDVRASGSDVVRIPLEIQGTGQLKSFTLDFAYPASLDILEVERAPVTQDWLGFGHGTPAPGSLRILGYDVYTVGLAEGEWTTLAYLVVRPNAEEASSGRFELVASWDDVEGVPLLGGDVTIAGGTGEGLPTEFALGVGRPNPSPGAVTIDYVVPAGPSRHVEISIFNVQGQLVRTLVDGAQVAGRHEAAWDGRDGSDHTVAAGTYFVRMNSGVFQQTHKLVQTR